MRFLYGCVALVGLLVATPPPSAPGSVPQNARAEVGAVARTSGASTSKARWAWPVEAPHPVIRPFEAPETKYSPGHRGIDIAAAEGAAVRAPEGGIVHFAGSVAGKPVVSLEHAGGLLSSFEPVVATVHEGDAVAEGDVIGTVAASDHCGAQACFHLGARLGGEYLNPMLLLGSIPRAVLLPVGETG